MNFDSISFRFSGWIIEKSLDEGGFGHVYLVKHKDGKRRAALKAEPNDVEGGSAIKLESMILFKLDKAPRCVHIPEFFAAAKRRKYCELGF